MDYRLEVKPTTYQEGVKYWPIPITNLAFHTIEKTPTPSVGKKIQTANEKDCAEGRIFAPLDPLALIDPKTYIINLFMQDPDFATFVKEKEAEGYKVVLAFPQGGITSGLGKDAEEFLKSKKWKRTQRAIAKGKIRD